MKTLYFFPLILILFVFSGCSKEPIETSTDGQLVSEIQVLFNFGPTSGPSMNAYTYHFFYDGQNRLDSIRYEDQFGPFPGPNWKFTYTQDNKLASHIHLYWAPTNTEHYLIYGQDEKLFSDSMIEENFVPYSLNTSVVLFNYNPGSVESHDKYFLPTILNKVFQKKDSQGNIISEKNEDGTLETLVEYDNHNNPLFGIIPIRHPLLVNSPLSMLFEYTLQKNNFKNIKDIRFSEIWKQYIFSNTYDEKGRLQSIKLVENSEYNGFTLYNFFYK